jgi:hypothetical protein
MKKEETWIKQYWRPFMAWQYALVCLFDFIVFPALSMYFLSQPWDPLTLKESGFYHLAMAAIVGVAAWTRGQEKITRMNQFGDEVSEESTTTSQTPVK